MALLGPRRGRSSFRTVNHPTKGGIISGRRGASAATGFWGAASRLRGPHDLVALATLLLLFTATQARAGACNAPAPIVFARGASAAEVTGASPRGTPECWTLQAHSGQHLSARVTSPGDNVVFQIYRPGSAITEGAPAPGSKPLDPSVSEGKDARAFSGKLPETGAYLFVLGPKWGGSEYKLQVEVTK